MRGGVVFLCGVPVGADYGGNFVADGHCSFEQFALVDDAIGDFGRGSTTNLPLADSMVPQSPTWPPISA